MNNVHTILAPHANHAQIISDLLKQDKAKAGVSLLPFHIFLSQLSDKSNDTALFVQAYDIIFNNRSSFLTLKDSLHYPEIVKQLVLFVKEMISYDIEIESLPESNPKEKDIKHIVYLIYDLFKHSITLSKIKKHIVDASEISIYPFYMSIFDHQVTQFLIKKKATYKSYPTFINPTKKAHYALNTSKEAEAITQHLFKHPNQKTLIVCCEQSTLPLMLTTFLSRYQLSYSIDITFRPSIVVDYYLLLVDFYLTNDIESLLEICASKIFDSKSQTELIQYINLRKCTLDDLMRPLIHYQNASFTSSIDKRDQQQLISLEIMAETQRQAIEQYLHNNESSPYVMAFNVLAKNINDFDELEQQTFFKMKEIIEDTIKTSTQTDQLRSLLEYLLLSIQPTSLKANENIHITNLKNGYQSGYDQVIVAGANQQHFPAFSKQTGIIDENYLEKINYPTLEERLSHHIKQLDYIYTCAPSIIFSYSTSTFEGKIQSESFDLIQDIPKSPWKISKFGEVPKKTYKLKPAIAKDLFFKEDSVYGSVSSFEVFFNCHYRYFLKSGLKLSNNDVEPTLVALMGTIAHNIVEDLKKNKISEYDEVQLKHKVSEYFKDLYTIYPTQVAYWQFIETRLFAQLSLAIQRLLAAEKDTSFEFFQAELQFEQSWELDATHKVILKGFIDRIDKTTDFIRILDYKSSEKNLSYKEVKAGLQLQLLTYAIVADNLFTQKISSVHYFSFLNEVVDIHSQKVNRNKIDVTTKDDYLKLFYNRHKLNSWFLDEEASMYHSDMFVKQLTSTGKVRKNGLYDKVKIHEFLLTTYSYLVDTLEKGDILRNPVKNACTYCDFKRICVFKDKYRELPDFDVENTLKGEKENA